ncbi:MAG: ABC transporter ATP-binding protein [Aerococcus sp.]|nr:ABC transporter ATP-binding protein [Aerococcus sp.]
MIINTLIMIEAHDLAVGYSKHLEEAVLHDLTFTIPTGHVVALVGSNGVGKSTLINTLIGINAPMHGDITVNLTPNPAGRSKNLFSNVGFCAQAQIMDWYTNVSTNVLSGPKMAGIPTTQAKKFTDKALDLMSISDLKTNPVDHLSGGQQQRVQVARELARQPLLYILDEPTTGLDAESSEQLLAYLKIQAATGATVIVSSHDLTIIEKFADILLLLDRGEMRYFGSMQDFLANSQTTNLIEVRFSPLERPLPDDLLAIGTFTENVLSVDETFGMQSLLALLAKYDLPIESVGRRKPTLRELYLSLRRG